MLEGILLRLSLCPLPGEHVHDLQYISSVQLSENIRATRHKPRGFLDEYNLASSVFNVGSHEESAHVSLGCANRRMFQDLVDALQVPGPRRPWVLVGKVPALFKLVSVQRATGLDVFHGLAFSTSCFSSRPGLSLCATLLK